MQKNHKNGTQTVCSMVHHFAQCPFTAHVTWDWKRAWKCNIHAKDSSLEKFMAVLWSCYCVLDAKNLWGWFLHREAVKGWKSCSLFGNYTGTAICVARKITEMERKFRHMLMSVVKHILFSLCLILDVHITGIILYHAEAPLKGQMAIATVPENSTALLWYVQTTQSKWMMVLCKSSTFKFP